MLSDHCYWHKDNEYEKSGWCQCSNEFREKIGGEEVEAVNISNS